jgi:methylthioribulose-1-phosphate dehydratase
MTEATEAIRQLTETGASLAQRGWLMGTSGNLSATLSLEPLHLIITASGQDKSRLASSSFVEVDGDGNVLDGVGQPSAETSLHRIIVKRKKAGSVLHVHSTWATVLSGLYAQQGGISISGYEMLKGLSGIKTHEHAEWLPILENSQNYVELSARLDSILLEYPNIHGVLLCGHGIYTWGVDVKEAQRHVEILEFLLEVIGRNHMIKGVHP